MTSKRRASVELEVPFHDVDSLSIVWHGNYYKYMAQARTALMRAHQLDNDAFRDHQTAILMVETRCHHSRPLRYADRFTAEAWFKSIDDQRITVSYAIKKDGARMARGRTVLVTVDRHGSLTPIADWIKERAGCL